MTDFANHNGYNPNFLSPNHPVPLPALQGQNIQQTKEGNRDWANHLRYSVCMSSDENRRSAVCVAAMMRGDRGGRTGQEFRQDPNYEPDQQLLNLYYADRYLHGGNDYDKGHLATKSLMGWGPNGDEACRETMYYSNSCLQWNWVNQDEIDAIEDVLRARFSTAEDKFCFFAGPIYGEQPRTLQPRGGARVHVPDGFFHVIVYLNQNTLESISYITPQNSVTMRNGQNLTHVRVVTRQDVQDLTGLDIAPGAVDQEVEVLLPPAPPSTVVLVRAMPNPEAGEPETVTLRNVSHNDTVKLGGWVLTDDDNRGADVFRANARIFPGEEITVAVSFKLGNRGDVLKLFRNDGVLADKKRYNGSERGVAVVLAEI